MIAPHELTSSGTEDRRIALAAVRDAKLYQGVWMKFVIHLVMQHENPRALVLALIFLKKYASSKWSAVREGSKEFQQIATIMHFIADSNEPLLAMMAMVILNRLPRFNFQLQVLTPGQQILPWKIYLENLDQHIAYTVIGPKGELISQHPTTIEAPDPFTIENIRLFKDKLFAEMTQHQHLCCHDRGWSRDLLQYAFNAPNPLALALIVAKCVELNVWNDARARVILTEIAELVPIWASIPGFISTFMSLSLNEFQVLNQGSFQPLQFEAMLIDSGMMTSERCIEHSSSLEFCLYLGLTLEKSGYQRLYPEAKIKFLEATGLVFEHFLEGDLHRVTAAAGPGRL